MVRIDGMTPEQADSAINIAVGVITPYATAIFTNPKMPPRMKVIIAVAMALLVGFAKTYMTGQLHSWGDVVYAAAFIFGVSTVTYGHIAQHFGLPQLEKATSVTPDETVERKEE